MSIEQTKLFKESIETPILKTNEVKAQVVEASQVASDDIWVLGYNLENVLFGDDVIEQIVDSTELLKSKYGVEPTYGAEQIVAFQMKVPQEYKGKYISSVTLRRRDTNTGVGQPIAQQEQVYLYANCMKENDVIVDTFYSIDKHRQTVDDGLQTTWNFDEPIKIKRNYNYIRFYCTRVRGERQNEQNPRDCINLRSSNVNFNNKRGLLDGWITIDQAGPIGFTTEFTVNLLSKELGFITHIQNTSIHLDEQKNNLLNSISDVSNDLSTHANNENVHITTDQKEKLKTLHILQTSYNIHKNNKTIHITEDERNKWDQKFGLNQIIDFLDVPATKVFSTLKQGFVNNSGGKCDAICIQLSQPHFTTGKIFEVQIPYTGGKDKTSYLCAQIFTKDEDENTKKTLKDCIFSENTQTQPSSSPDNPKVCYQFNNLVLPQDYKFVRFIFTEDNNRLPDISTEENCVAMRVKIITQQSNETGWDDWDDDECILYIDRNTTKNWYGYVNAVQPEKIYGVTQQEKDNWNDHVGNNDIHVTTNDKTNISKVPSLETDINTHVGNNDIHVTADEKEKWNSIEIPQPITYTSGDNISINSDNAISVVTTNVISNSNKIPTTKAIYDDFYNEKSFDNYDTSKYTCLPDTVGTIVLSKKHFISGGRITKVTVPHGTTQEDRNNGQGGFLVIDVFTEDNQHDEGYNIHSPKYRYCADEYYAYKNRLNEGHYEWTFNNTNCIIPDNFKAVHLSLVIDNANLADVGVGSTTNAKFRINCLAKNGDRDEGVVFEEDDECRLYWNGNTNGANRIGIVNVDYVEHKFDTIGDKLENHISSDVHLSSSDKTNISKVSQIESSINEHISSGSHITNETKIEIDKIATIKIKLDQHIDQNQSSHVSQVDRTNWNDKVSSSQFNNLTTNYNNLTTKYNNLTTILNNSLADIEIFTTLDSGAYKVSSSGKCNATGIQLSREHFVTGSIKALEIYNLNGISAENIRLCAIVFHHGEDENSPKTIDDCIFSTNTCTQVETNNPGSMVFRFNNLELPDDYEFVRFLFARGTDVVPAHNDANTVIQARVQVLAQNIDGNANFTESPDDECKTLHISGTSNWYPYVRVIKTVLGYGDIVSLLNRISALESRVSELENS